MARSNVRTYGLLNRWPLVVHEDVFTFNQFTGGGVRLVPNRQNTPYIQYERDYIADALFDAVNTVKDYLGFYPCPTWIESEIVTVNCDKAWNRQLLETRYGHLAEFGKRAVTVIEAAAAVTYSDPDGDGTDELATVTVTSAVDTDEIQVFFRTADGAPSAAHEYWQIDGLTITASGGTVTIKGHAALFANPDLWTVEYTANSISQKNGGDTATAGNFVTAVDVYRVYADATEAVQLILNPDIVGETSTPVYATADIVNADSGQFTLRTDDGQEWPNAQPQTVKVWYRTGLPLVNGQMDRRLETQIVRYANTLMPQQPAMMDRTLAMWQQDNKTYELPLIGYPAFGVKVAAVDLARVVDSLRHHLKGQTVFLK